MVAVDSGGKEQHTAAEITFRCSRPCQIFTNKNHHLLHSLSSSLIFQSECAFFSLVLLLSPLINWLTLIPSISMVSKPTDSALKLPRVSLSPSFFISSTNTNSFPSLIITFLDYWIESDSSEFSVMFSTWNTTTAIQFTSSRAFRSPFIFNFNLCFVHANSFSKRYTVNI